MQKYNLCSILVSQYWVYCEHTSSSQRTAVRLWALNAESEQTRALIRSRFQLFWSSFFPRWLTQIHRIPFPLDICKYESQRIFGSSLLILLRRNQSLRRFTVLRFFLPKLYLHSGTVKPKVAVNYPHNPKQDWKSSLCGPPEVDPFLNNNNDNY